MAKILNEIYSNPNHPSSFSSNNKLFEAVCQNKKKISRKQVSDFLSGTDSYTLFKNRRVNFQTAKTESISTDQFWQIDLSCIIHLASENNGAKYLFFCIDTFSRYLWIRPIKNKSSNETSKAILNIFNEGRIPGYIVSDCGTEFQGQFKEILKQFNVGYITLHGSSKASIAERVQRTIKSKIFRYLNHLNSKRYIDVLQNFVNTYNNSYHRIINSTPTKKSLIKFSNKQIQNTNLSKRETHKYSIGDFVRVSRSRSDFGKGFEGTFNLEVFKIDKLLFRSNIKVYKLKDLNNKVIEGIFYEQEIQKIKFDSNSFFKIEKLLHKKK